MAEQPLSDYHAKRNFDATPEPAGEVAPPDEDGHRWVIQEHAARRLHYDFRLEVGGVLVSWAVPKGPSYDPTVKRLAVKVEDHPLDYRDFEGIIPGGNYGQGSVIVWDEGTYRNLTEKGSKPVPMEEAVDHGHVSVWLEGQKLRGGWSLTRFGADAKNWGLVKRKDEFADPAKDITADAPRSVKSGRTLEEVAQDPDAREWQSNRPSTDRPNTDRPSASRLSAGRPGTSQPGADRPSTSQPGAGERLAPARFLEPMLAESGAARTRQSAGARGPLAAPDGEWLLEPKLDGLRCIAVRNGADVALFSRNQLPFNDRFPGIVSAVRSLPATNFVLDGEVVSLVDRHPDFAALQQGEVEVEYWVFDMPWLLGQDLRHLPVEERKNLLVKAVPDGSPEDGRPEDGRPIRVVLPLHGNAADLFRSACAQGWEGLVAKRAGSLYRAGRSPDWHKLKCECRQDLVIGGFTAPQGSRDDFGALLLGYWDGDDLVYAGKVGSGFSRETLRDMFRALSALERPSSPFAGRPFAGKHNKGTRWVEPVLVAEIVFSNWTRDGLLRHPRFARLRPDKASRDIVREECGPGSAGTGPPGPGWPVAEQVSGRKDGVP